MGATQQRINKLHADNIKILQTPPPEGADPLEHSRRSGEAIAENMRKVRALSRQLNGQ